MEQTFVQARVQCLEFSNGRIRVARSGQDSELRWFLAAVTVVSIVALYYLQLDWLKLISRLPDLGKTFGLLALLDFHDFIRAVQPRHPGSLPAARPESPGRRTAVGKRFYRKKRRGDPAI